MNFLEKRLEAHRKQREDFSDLRDLKARKEADVFELEAKLNNARDDLSRLKSEKDGLNDRRRAIQDRIENLQLQISNQENYIQSLKREARELEEPKLRSDIQNAETEIRRANDRLIRLREEKNGLNNMLSDIQSKLRIAEDSYENADRICNELKSNIDKIKQREQALLNDQKNAEKQLHDAKNFHDNSVKLIDSLNRERERINADIGDLDERAMRIEQEIRRLNSEKEMVANQSNEKRLKLQQVSSQFEEARIQEGKAADAERSAKDVLNTCNFAVNSQRRIFEDQEKLYDASVQKRRESETEIVTGRNLASQVNERIESINNEIDSLQNNRIPNLMDKVSKVTSF